jgi:hypothetical protein
MKSSNEQIQDAVAQILSSEFENSSYAAQETGVLRQTVGGHNGCKRWKAKERRSHGRVSFGDIGM